MPSLCNWCVAIARNSAPLGRCMAFFSCNYIFTSVRPRRLSLWFIAIRPPCGTSVPKPSHYWFVCCTPCVRRPGRYALHPVSWRPEMSEASQTSGFELSGPPQCSSRVTSNLVGEPHLSTLTTLSGLVVPSPSAAARDTPVLRLYSLKVVTICQSLCQRTAHPFAI